MTTDQTSPLGPYYVQYRLPYNQTGSSPLTFFFYLMTLFETSNKKKLKFYDKEEISL